MKHQARAYDVSPAFIPQAVAWTVLALSIALALSSLLRLRGETQAPEQLILLPTLGWLGVFVLAWLGLAHLGFLVVAPLLVAGGMIYSGQRSWRAFWRLVLPIAVLLPLLVDLAAWRIFTVQLP